MTAHNDKNVKYSIIRKTVMGVFLLLFCAFITLIIFENNLKDVVLMYNGHVYATRTIEQTVGTFMDKNNIPYNSHDYINISPDELLYSNQENEISIKTAVPVTLRYDGKELNIMTYKETINEVLEDYNVKIYKDDKLLGMSMDDAIKPNMNIQVVRVTKGVDVKNFDLPYSTEFIQNPDMAINKSRVKTEGEFGERCTITKITYEDGVEANREVIMDEVLKEPVNQVIEYGTIPVKKIPGTDQSFMYTRVVTMTATAYTLDPAETGGKYPGDPGYGITASGVPATRGVIAVDPKVIPLGTKVYVESLNSRFSDYGISLAADTGTGINGKKIDLFMEQKTEAINWGIRKVNVYFIYEK